MRADPAFTLSIRKTNAGFVLRFLHRNRKEQPVVTTETIRLLSDHVGCSVTRLSAFGALDYGKSIAGFSTPKEARQGNSRQDLPAVKWCRSRQLYEAPPVLIGSWSGSGLRHSAAQHHRQHRPPTWDLTVLLLPAIALSARRVGLCIDGVLKSEKKMKQEGRKEAATHARIGEIAASCAR